jgi:hypothetical protein
MYSHPNPFLLTDCQVHVIVIYNLHIFSMISPSDIVSINDSETENYQSV